jgi:hypothetical protein
VRPARSTLRQTESLPRQPPNFCYHRLVPLSWNEVRHRAVAFSKEWTGAKREQAEKQTFWNEFFEVFGIRRRAVASFEEPAKKIAEQYGYIDLLAGIRHLRKIEYQGTVLVSLPLSTDVRQTRILF